MKRIIFIIMFVISCISTYANYDLKTSLVGNKLNIYHDNVFISKEKITGREVFKVEFIQQTDSVEVVLYGKHQNMFIQNGKLYINGSRYYDETIEKLYRQCIVFLALDRYVSITLIDNR